MKTRRIRKKLSPMQRRDTKAFYLIMTPYILMFFAFKIFPMIWGIIMSFTNYSGFNLNSLKFVGLSNYERVFTDSDAFYSFGRVLLIGIVVIPLTMLICNFMAIILSLELRAVGVFRTLFYIPSIIPAVAIATIWNGMYLRDGGVFNELIKLFGGEPVTWIGYDWAFYSLILMMLWSAGAGVLNNIAAIKNIPTDVYEAAKIDGATLWDRVRYIMLPLLTPMNYMALVTGLITTLQLFSEPVLLQGGGMTSVPIRPIYTYMVHTYQQIFVNLRFGYGLALTWVIFAIIMIMTLLNQWTSKKWVHDDMN